MLAAAIAHQADAAVEARDRISRRVSVPWLFFAPLFVFPNCSSSLPERKAFKIVTDDSTSFALAILDRDVGDTANSREAKALALGSSVAPVIIINKSNNNQVQGG